MAQSSTPATAAPLNDLFGNLNMNSGPTTAPVASPAFNPSPFGQAMPQTTTAPVMGMGQPVTQQQ